MSLIMGPIGPEQLELFALELGKIAAFDFVYSLASTNINQSANLVTMNRSIDLMSLLGHNKYEHRSQMSLIKGQVIPDHSCYLPLK